jgi:hypothetical protein
LTNAEKLQRILDDPLLFIQTFVKIVDKRGKLVKFVPNPQQKQLLNEMDKFNVVLKSRQLGISVLSCAYSIWLAIRYPNTSCLLMAHSLDGADGIFTKLKQLYGSIPEAIRPRLINNNRKELKLENGSRITVISCGTKESVRGSTLRFVHVSEAAFCNENIDRQILAIEQCLTPNGQIIVESTANGFNFFSDMYLKAAQGESLYRPFFFGWIEDRLMFEDEYHQFAERYKALNGSLPTVEELDSAELALYHRGATMEQIVWRRLKISNSSETQFAQEFPSTPSEAFISTGDNVFDNKKVHERIENKKTKTIPMPESLPDVLKPWYNRGFSLWEKPEPGLRYFIGVDSAEGLGGSSDYSVAEVIDREGFQVAEFRSNKIKPFEFVEVIEKLGRWFNTAYLVVEKASAGQTVCDRLYNDVSYPLMYKYKSWDARGTSKRKPGFETTKQSKQRIIDDFVEMHSKDMLCINSDVLLNEMKMFVYKDGSAKASIGYHDDTVMAFAMALFGAKESPNYIDYR